jgi:hypothetical protein
MCIPHVMLLSWRLGTLQIMLSEMIMREFCYDVAQSGWLGTLQNITNHYSIQIYLMHWVLL